MENQMPVPDERPDAGPVETANADCDSQHEADEFQLAACPVEPPPGGVEEVIREGRRLLRDHCQLVDRSHHALYSVLAYAFVQSAWLDHFNYRNDKEKLHIEAMEATKSAEDFTEKLKSAPARDLLLMVYFGATQEEAPLRSKYRTLFKAADEAKVALVEADFVEWVEANGGYEAIIEVYRAAHPGKAGKSRATPGGGTANEPVSLLTEIETKLKLSWDEAETVRLRLDPEQDVFDGLTLLFAHPTTEAAEDGSFECKIIRKIADPALIAGATELATHDVDEAADLAEFERETLWKINRFMLRYRKAIPGKADYNAYKTFRTAIIALSKHPVLGPKYFDGPAKLPTIQLDGPEGVPLFMPQVRSGAGALDPALYVGNAKVGALVPFEYDHKGEGLKYDKGVLAYLASRPKRTKSAAA